MSYKVVFLSIGMRGQNEAFEEPGINSIVSFLRKADIETDVELVLNGNLDVDKILNQKPLIIGMSVYVDTYHIVKAICKTIKSKDNNIRIVLGGYAATYYPEILLRDIPDADFISVGEGELALRELVLCLINDSNLESVHNLVYRENEEIKHTETLPLIEDLDILPFAARDIALQNNVAEVWISTSRGCSHNCSFCCSHNFWKKNKYCAWRGRSIDNILKEIDYLTNDLGIRQFEFIDNSFEDPFPFLKRTMEIANGIISKNYKVAFGANMRAETFERITILQLDRLKQAGLSYVYLGIEGFNDNSLKLYNKAATVKNNDHALSLLDRAGIAVDIGFINFNPYSTVDDLIININNLSKHNLAFIQYILTFLFVFRGTALHEKLKKEGILYRDECIDDYLAYHYVDNNVEKLAEFLINYKKKIEESGVTHENYFLVYFNKKLHQLSNLLEQYNLNDKKICELIDSARKTIILETNRINGINKNWFLKLIEMTKGDFFEEEANILSDEVFLNENYQKELDLLLSLKDTVYSAAYKRFVKKGLRIVF